MLFEPKYYTVPISLAVEDARVFERIVRFIEEDNGRMADEETFSRDIYENGKA